MRRVVPVILLALIVSACATRPPPSEPVTVHLYSNRTDSAETERIATSLRQAGYRIRIHAAALPRNLTVDETIVAHGDSSSDSRRANSLAGLLDDQHGIRPRIERRSGGGPSAPSAEIGLYIHRPEQAQSQPILKIATLFAGTCGRTTIDLELLAGGVYRLRQHRWQSDYQRVPTGTEHGEWRARGSGYEMTSDQGSWWALEPQLDGANPVERVVFVRQHDRIEGCRLEEAI